MQLAVYFKPLLEWAFLMLLKVSNDVADNGDEVIMKTMKAH